jgi:hypothetical protein
MSVDNDLILDVEAHRNAPENEQAFDVITVAMGIERHAKSMRLGTVAPEACALAIVELLKQIPGVRDVR